MIIPLTPFLWSMIQVALLASLALGLSWALRGRAPQWSSSMLAGAAVAAFLLTLVAWIPSSHWSLASILRMTTEPLSNDAAQTNLRGNVESADPSDQESTHRPRAIVKQHWPLTPGSEQLGRLIASTSLWLNASLRSVDSGIRQFEQTTSTGRTRLAWLQSLISLVILMLAGLWMHSWLWIRWVVRSSQPIHDEALRLRMTSIARQLRISALPELLQSSRVGIGATVGLLRRRLILSPQWHEWSETEIDAVLSHELAHVVRHDYAWVLLSSWIRVVLFYHPLIHVLVRRLRLEQELAADQLAAGLMNNARAYGRALASLALRAECAAKVPSSVLTADQVCIVRRVTMLKQGSLRPIKTHRRWSTLVIALTIIAVAPLSGLRGTPPQTVATTANDRPESTQTDGAKEHSQQEASAHREEFALAQKQFPPLTLVGRLKWEPGKLLTKNTAPSIRYMQDLVSAALFEQFIADGEVQAAATATLSWESRAREGGRFTFNATSDMAKGIEPQAILRLITNPLLMNYKLDPSVTKSIAGKQARLVASGKPPQTLKAPAAEQAAYWFIQDDQSFYVGTEEELVAQLGSQDSKTPKQLIDVPEAYRQQFESSAFALVYNDCDQWDDRLSEFFAGSPKESQATAALAYIKGLTQIGFFIDATNASSDHNTFPLCIRISYENHTAAQEGMGMIHSLLGLARLIPNSDQSAPFARELAEHTLVFINGKEVILQVADSKLCDMFCEKALPETLVGWTDILATVTSTETPGTVKFTCNHGFGTSGFLAQSVQALPYSGKRIRISADIGCSELEHARCGTIIWGSDAQDRTVGNATSGKSIGQPIQTSEIIKEMTSPATAKPTVWRRESVEWNVPDTATALSFGIYLANGDVLVRNMKFEVVGKATGESETQIASSPRNLLRVPTRTLLAEPRNLDFSQTPILRTATLK